MPKSAYILAIENLSSATRCRDIRDECERFGTVLDVERDKNERLALVEFKHSADAKDAYNKLDGVEIDGRRWEVFFASKKDLDFMGWEWNEGEGKGGGAMPLAPGSTRTRSPSPVREHHSG